MSIIKRPKPQKPTTAPEQQAEAAITAFIAGAPDAPAAQAVPVPARPAKVMINVQMPADLLAKVDEAAAALSLTRSGFIKLVLTRSVQTTGN